MSTRKTATLMVPSRPTFGRCPERVRVRAVRVAKRFPRLRGLAGPSPCPSPGGRGESRPGRPAARRRPVVGRAGFPLARLTPFDGGLSAAGRPRTSLQMQKLATKGVAAGEREEWKIPLPSLPGWPASSTASKTLCPLSRSARRPRALMPRRCRPRRVAPRWRNARGPPAMLPGTSTVCADAAGGGRHVEAACRASQCPRAIRPHTPVVPRDRGARRRFPGGGLAGAVGPAAAGDGRIGTRTPREVTSRTAAATAAGDGIVGLVSRGGICNPGLVTVPTPSPAAKGQRRRRRPKRALLCRSRRVVRRRPCGRRPMRGRRRRWPRRRTRPPRPSPPTAAPPRPPSARTPATTPT